MPQKPLPKTPREMKQCQHCMKPDSDDNPLRTCSKCRRAHYCTRECQLADWESHKPICKMNRECRDDLKSESELSGVPLADIETKLKRWIQLCRPTLCWGLVNALTVGITPERIRTHLLYVTLSPKFSFDSLPKRDKDIRTAFKLEDAAVYPIDKFRDMLDEEQGSIFNDVLRNVRNSNRAEHIPHLGFAFVAIKIPAIRMLRFLPFDMESDLIGVPSARDWKNLLSNALEHGRN